MLTAIEDRTDFSYRSRSDASDSFYRRTSVVASGSRSFETRVRTLGNSKRRRATRRNKKVVGPGSVRLRRNKHWSW